jgi:hypothetical protein
MKNQTVIIVVICIIALIIIYIKVVEPALQNVQTLATTGSKANSILSSLGL